MGAVKAPGRYEAGDLDGAIRRGATGRLYAGLLRLYPSTFRERYAEEMAVLFADQLRDASHRRRHGGVAAVWGRGLIDLAAHAVGEHLRRDRSVAQSLATFEPSRSMRLLGLFGVVGAGLLLWAFISFNPFDDPTLNLIRLVTFALAGAAIAVAFHSRQAMSAPRLAVVTTTLVVVSGVWYATWVILAAGVEDPFLGAFGFVNMLASIALWVSPTIWALGMLHTSAAWQGMPRRLALLTMIAMWALVGSAVAWLGDDRLGLVDSLWGDLWQAVALTGVAMNGIGWGLLGAVILIGGRGGQRA